MVGAGTALAANKATPWVIGGVVVLSLGLIYFGIARPIMCKVGLVNCKSTRDREKLIGKIKGFEGFKPNYYNPNRLTISPFRAKELADQLHKAGGLMNDDEDSFYAALREAGTKDNLSYISKQYNIRHGESLGENVVYYLDSGEEIETVWTILEAF